MEEVNKVLSHLLSTESELEKSAQKLATLLHKSSISGTLLQQQEQAFELSLVKTLLGIVGSSECPGLLTECVRCLALLVHGNDTARVLLGKMDALALLVNLLSPRSCHGSDKCWHFEWVGVYAQALIALRKLTYLNEDNQQNLALNGGIKLIVTMVNDDNIMTNFKKFPAEAKVELESLVLKQTFMSNVQPATDDEKLSIMAHFSAFRYQGSVPASYYPVFSVIPLDVQNKPITTTLLSKGVVWPDPSPLPSENKLTCLQVTHVVDGGHQWCQFVSKKQKKVSVIISDTLALLPPPTQSASKIPLILGDVYAAYLDSEQWVRARLLLLEIGSNKETCGATVLAIDYGYCVTITTECLQRLPLKCRGIPPQAIPCKLAGVQPPPASLGILENAAAILRNMAFDMFIFRKEIINFKGTETLLKMLRYPHKPTVMQALGALLNISVSPELREEMGKRGAIRRLLDLIRNSNELGTEMLEQVICCLYNIVLDCNPNVSLLLKLEGGCVLAKLPVKQFSRSVQEYLNKLVQMLSPCKVSSKKKMHESRNAVCQVLDSDEDSECEAVGCGPSGGVESGTRDDSMVYVANRLLPGSPQESNTCSFLSVNCLDNVTTSKVRRTLCAFVNSGKKCILHIGVDKEGVVKGLKIKRKEKDLFSVAADNMMSGFTPSVFHKQYSIQFVPVVNNDQQCLADMYVVDFTVNESGHHQVYTIKEDDNGTSVNRCYYRFGTFNEVLTCQDLRDMVARREAEKCQSELNTLAKNIARLKTAVNAHT